MTDANIIAEVIAERFYESFADELHEWLFVFKTEATLDDNSTIISSAEGAMCGAHNITIDDYVNETICDYDNIFQPSTEIVEDVIKLMLKRFTE